MLDARGKACPLPVVLAMKELDRMDPGEILEVLVDNEAAVGNLTHMASGKGAEARNEKDGDDWRVFITRGSTGEAAASKELAGQEAENAFCDASGGRRGTLVVAIGTDCMGQGDDKLGRILMKSYLFSLTQQEEIPKTIMFFNGGVKLTTEGSESLKDIEELAARGAEIMSCGTCLDFYGLKESLKVGGITNMYAIAETMQKADRLVRI